MRTSGRYSRTLALLLLLGMPVLSSAQNLVTINEIHCNPTNALDWVEFVELYNAGSTQANVSGWFFSKGITYTFPPATYLAAGAFLIVGQDLADINTKFGVSGAGVYGPFAGKLSGEGEQIELRDSGGAVAASVNYSVGFPWPTVGDNDFSIQRLNPLLDGELGGNWRSAWPTPKAQNSVYAATNATPPCIRQVDHDPNQPTSGEIVTITAKVTDLQWI